MSTKFLSLTAARKELFRLCEEVQAPSTYITLTLEGQPKVVMMSQKEFELVVELKMALCDPGIIKAIRQHGKKLKFVTFADLKNQLQSLHRGHMSYK